MSSKKTSLAAALLIIGIAASAFLASTGLAAQIDSLAKVADQPLNSVTPWAYIPMVANMHCGNFFDDFSDPASGWTVENYEPVDFGYDNGEYRIYAKSDQYVFTVASPACPRQAYTIEVDGRWVGEPGNSIGIVFGITGNFDAYYLYEISTIHQMFRLNYRGPGGWEEVVGPTTDYAIFSNNAINHLEVTTDGHYIALKANGVVLAALTDSRTIGLARAGVASSSKNGQARSDARFDNFQSWAPAPDPSLPAALSDSQPMAQEVRFERLESRGALPDWKPGP